MHEAGLMRDLMRRIEAAAGAEGAGRVVGVSVRLGALSHFTPAHFAEHFAQAAAGSRAEGARLEIETCDDIHAPGAQGVLLRSLEVEA